MALEGDDWARLDGLLDAALDRAPAERARFLDEACGRDTELRARVGRLLALAEDPKGGLQPGEVLRDPVFEELARGMEGEGRLAPGESLGRFVVRGLLGVGGMGVVYRALDPSLGREVAIKVVSGDLLEEATSLRRVEREARLLATLNHPNVGAIYGLEVIEGAPYLVLELVEGETLLERLGRGPLPMAELVVVGVQIADALQEAHRKGIVHRDLKPANVKLGDSGRVKVLDFGIAKPMGAAEATGPMAGVEPTTTPGTLLGTASYMSPEQARGLPVDQRSDLWAFGCLLYEMLTGQRAFPGASVSDVLAAVLRDEPDWSALPADTPRGVRRLLRRCLRKDPRDRLQDAGDARIELTEAAMEEPPSLPARASRLPGMLLGAAGLGAAALLLLLFAWSRMGVGPGSPGVARLNLDLPPGLRLAEEFPAPFAFSPDGAALVLVAREGERPEIFERELSGLELRRIAGTEGATQPVFSPDGLSLAFFADRKLKRVPRTGGAALVIAEIGGNPRGASWGEDGTIVLAPHQTSGLLRVAAGGGTPRTLTRLDESADEGSHRWPQVLPGGTHALYTVAVEDGTYDEARVEVVSLASGERKRILEGGAYARYVPSGHLVFVRGGRLLAVPFDPVRLEVKGIPQIVVEGVRYDPQNGGSHIAVSGTGALVYGPGVPGSSEHPLSFVDRAFRVTQVGETPRAYREQTLSPDGRRVAVVIGGATESDLWVVDVASGTHSRLTFGLRPRRPTWTPDGKGITIGARRGSGWALETVPRDGSGRPATLLETAHRAYPNAWSPDGRTLVYQERRPETGWDLMALDLTPAGVPKAPRALVASPFQEENASLSKDGRFLAYESDELDSVFEIYVRPARGGGPQVRASTRGARWPRFGSSGRLYYWYSSRGGLKRIDYHAEGDRFVAEREEFVWPGSEERVADLAQRVLVLGTYAGYDVDPASERFLMLERTASPEAPYRSPVLVLNWQNELKALDYRRP
jgi:serine/threonine protein kinase/Tol biopolymer transport system component